MKTCFKCGQRQPLEEFYKHAQMGDGHLGKCKACTRKDSAERRARLDLIPEERVKEMARHREKSRKYRADGRAKPISNSRRVDAIKKQANTAVGNALKSGKLEKHPCVKCGAFPSQAHHEDYSKPLDVVWLCVKHHAARHVELRREAILNA